VSARATHPLRWKEFSAVLRKGGRGCRLRVSVTLKSRRSDCKGDGWGFRGGGRGAEGLEREGERAGSAGSGLPRGSSSCARPLRAGGAGRG